MMLLDQFLLTWGIKILKTRYIVLTKRTLKKRHLFYLKILMWLLSVIYQMNYQ